MSDTRYCPRCDLRVPPAPYCTNCGDDAIDVSAAAPVQYRILRTELVRREHTFNVTLTPEQAARLEAMQEDCESAESVDEWLDEANVLDSTAWADATVEIDGVDHRDLRVEVERRPLVALLSPPPVDPVARLSFPARGARGGTDVEVFRSEIDGALVVQVDTDTEPSVGRVRIFVNDGAVYDADPDRA